MLGRHLLKSWSSTQASVSLSSGEAEFYGVVKAAGITLGFQALLRDVGHTLPVRVWTDSSATLGICGRQGLGKLRHLDTHYLWVQQKVRTGAIELLKVRGEENPADLFTKHLTGQDRVKELLGMMGCEYRQGRAGAAPLLREGAGTSKGELLSVQQEAHEDKILWDGHLFPVTVEDGQRVPEAYRSEAGLLPHLHADVECRYPKAHAAGEVDDPDPPEHQGLEVRGDEIGRGTARYRKNDSVEVIKDSRPKMHDVRDMVDGDERRWKSV